MKKLSDKQFKTQHKVLKGKLTKLRNRQDQERTLLNEQMRKLKQQHKHHGGQKQYSWSGKVVGQFCSVCGDSYKLR